MFLAWSTVFALILGTLYYTSTLLQLIPSMFSLRFLCHVHLNICSCYASNHLVNQVHVIIDLMFYLMLCKSIVGLTSFDISENLGHRDTYDGKILI